MEPETAMVEDTEEIHARALVLFDELIARCRAMLADVRATSAFERDGKTFVVWDSAQHMVTVGHRPGATVEARARTLAHWSVRATMARDERGRDGDDGPE